MTAWASLVNAAQIQPGETILVVGAAGAVGQAAIQIANWKRARVIGADMRSDPIPGADAVINTQTEDLEQRVLELTAWRRVDAVFDTVGVPLFEPALRSLKPGGRQVAISSPGNPRVSFNLVDFYHNSSRLVGVDSYGLTSRQIAEIQDELRLGFENGCFETTVDRGRSVRERRGCIQPGGCPAGENQAGAQLLVMSISTTPSFPS